MLWLWVFVTGWQHRAIVIQANLKEIDRIYKYMGAIN